MITKNDHHDLQNSLLGQVNMRNVVIKTEKIPDYFTIHFGIT